MNTPSASPTSHHSLNRLSLQSIRQSVASQEHVPNEVLLAVDDSVALQSLSGEVGFSVLKESDGFVRARVPEGTDLAEKIAELRATPGVKAADVNAIIERGEMNQGLPNDLTEDLWGLHNTGQNDGIAGADIKAVSAWKEVTGARDGVVIAVIDTGVDITHPDLQANIWTNPGEIAGNGIDDDGNGVIDDVHGYNAADDNADVSDSNGHGTHVAGTIGAVGNNGRGVVGVNWQAQIMPVKIFDDNGRATLDGIVRGINYAKNQGAKITNNSWGSRGYNEVLDQAFGAAGGMLHAVAAGNSGANIDLGGSYPAALGHDHIVSVAATNRKDELASFSNYGRYAVDVSAPGRDIHSTWPGGKYRTISGTSMASPHVAGAAGLLMQKYPEASIQEIKDRLIYNSDPKEQLADASQSGGRLNVAAALAEDTAAPAAPNDLRVAEIGTEHFTVSWTVPGDDGWCGNGASGFEYKLSTKPIETLEDFEALPNRTSRPNTKKVGEIYQIRQFRPQTHEDTTYYAALRVRDDVGNVSEIKKATFHIPGFDVLFEDDMETKGNWTPDETWGTEQVAGRGTVWSDSPGGNYLDNANATLTSGFVDLTNHQNCAMQVEYKVDVASGDHAYVEWSEDGENWNTVSQVFAQDHDFRATRFDLSNVSGKKAQFRFRLKSDDHTTRDGIMVDKVRIIGAPSTQP